MTALAAARARSQEIWKYKRFTLLSGSIAYQGGIACIDTTTGKVVPGSTATTLLVIGMFAETIDASAGDKLVNVDLGREVAIEWLVNSGSGAVASTDVGSVCYVKDDQTVTITPTGASIAGRVWAVDSTRGVAVERLADVPSPTATLDALTAVDTSPGSFSAGDLVIASNPHSGAIFEIPTTAANSTVTLPATAVEGTVCHFVADGSHNGHTVQYRDATGPTNITTALTASKRHMVVAAFLNSKWRAIAYVSP
jgi:hypothetical protein